MCGAGLSPDLLESTCFVRADGRKNPGLDPALRVMRVRDDAKTRKAAASRLRRNSKAPSVLISPTGFVERAEPESSVSSEIQLLLAAMFQVSVSQARSLVNRLPTEFQYASAVSCSHT